MEQAGKTSEQLLANVLNVVTSNILQDGIQVISVFRSGQSSSGQSNLLSHTREIVSKMSSYIRIQLPAWKTLRNL